MNKSIWLARLLYRHKEGLTKQEILNAWAEEDDHGRPMATSTFYDNRGYLETRFGMRIECRNGRYRLTTEVPDSEALLRQLLDEDNEINAQKEREAGEEWLTPLADAVANNKHVEAVYAPLDKSHTPPRSRLISYAASADTAMWWLKAVDTAKYATSPSTASRN